MYLNPVMSVSKRLLPIFSILSLSFLFINFYNSEARQSLQQKLPQHIGFGDWSRPSLLYGGSDEPIPVKPQPAFRPGVPKAPGSNYTRTLVAPRMKEEDISWMDEELPSDIVRKIYVADDPHAPLHPPKNKGNEVMVYLTYLIDHYDHLSDITIFVHSHQRAWHNNDLAGNDAAEMLRRLSNERVTREGYMNLRCQWYPGCPDWMHPGETEQNEFKTEEILIAKAWAELFPLDPVPKVLAQPCCAQFAMSRERIQSIPRSQFVFYRDWLLKTPLQSFVSGRVWEYMWQYALSGEASRCPVEHACYCDGYGICFGGEEQYYAWFDLRNQYNDLAFKLNEWDDMDSKVKEAIEAGDTELAEGLDKPEEGKNEEYKREMAELASELDERLNLAKERGDSPRNRAMEAGREWNEGDGF